MNKFILVLLSSALIFSCSKDSSSPEPSTPPPISSPPETKVTMTGYMEVSKYDINWNLIIQDSVYPVTSEIDGEFPTFTVSNNFPYASYLKGTISEITAVGAYQPAPYEEYINIQGSIGGTGMFSQNGIYGVVKSEKDTLAYEVEYYDTDGNFIRYYFLGWVDTLGNGGGSGGNGDPYFLDIIPQAFMSPYNCITGTCPLEFEADCDWANEFMWIFEMNTPFTYKDTIIKNINEPVLFDPNKFVTQSYSLNTNCLNPEVKVTCIASTIDHTETVTETFDYSYDNLQSISVSVDGIDVTSTIKPYFFTYPYHKGHFFGNSLGEILLNIDLGVAPGYDDRINLYFGGTTPPDIFGGSFYNPGEFGTWQTLNIGEVKVAYDEGLDTYLSQPEDNPYPITGYTRYYPINTTSSNAFGIDGFVDFSFTIDVKKTPSATEVHKSIQISGYLPFINED